MAGVMAVSMRAGLRARVQFHSRCFSTGIPMSEIEQMINDASTHRPEVRAHRPEVQAQHFGKSQATARQFHEKPQSVGLHSEQKPTIPRLQAEQKPRLHAEQKPTIPRAEIEQMIAEALKPPPRDDVPSREDILAEERLREEVARNAELQARLLEEQGLNARNTEKIAQSLETAAADRAKLQEQIEHLYKDLHTVTSQMLKEQVGIRQRVQRKGVKGRGGQSRMAYRPTIENAERQPTHVCEMSHQSMAELAMLGNHCARRERLLREIMAVDGVSWGKAHEVLNKMDDYNERYYWYESTPYRIGITCAVFGCIFGSLMVFSRPVAVWYGENVAGEELPEGVKDISELTTNQVGTWTWSWMEPMIGTASFVLLCCQFTRSQMMKMNMKTYADQLLQWRSNRLAKQFPLYDGSMVRAWGQHMPPVGLNFFPIYERRAGYRGFTSGL